MIITDVLVLYELQKQDQVSKMKQYLQRMRCSSSLFSIAIFYTILFTLLGPRQTFGIRWLALSKLSSVATVDQPPSKMCDSMKGSLIKKQITFCKRNPMFMDSVQRGAAQAIDECQFQFRSRRWNCSTLVQDKIDSDYQQLRSQLGDYGRGSSSTGMEGDRRYSHMLPPSKMSGTGMNGRQTFSGDQLQGLSNLPYQPSQQQQRSLLDGTKPNRMQVSPSSSSSNMMGFGSMSSGQQFLNDELKEVGGITQEIEGHHLTDPIHKLIVRNKFSNRNIPEGVTLTIHVPPILSNLNKEDTTQIMEMLEITEA